MGRLYLTRTTSALQHLVSQNNRSKMAQSKNNMINMLSSFNQILLIYTLFQILISPLVNQTEANSNTIEFDEDFFVEEVLLDRAEPLSGFLSSVGVLLVAGVSSVILDTIKRRCQPC